MTTLLNSAYTIDYTLLNNSIVLFFLFILSGLVSGAEVALFSLTKFDLENPAPSEQKKVDIITSLLNQPKKLLATILIANNLINIGIIILFYQIGDVLFLDLAEWLKFVLEVVVITFLILFFGEVLPKVYASRNKYTFALAITYMIYVADILFTPLSKPMRYLTILIQKRLKEQKGNISVDQLSQALELTSESETSHQEQKILKGIVSFGNTDASQVMQPRIDMFALEIGEPYQEVLNKIRDKGYSRIPVYKENVDHIEGILFVKDLIPHLDKADFDWKRLIRTPLFVPENKKLDDLLKHFQTTKNHLAIVVDEYGGTSGLISLEDVIEEIVGNISDEFDDVDINHLKIDDKNYVFEGKTSLRDFYRVLAIDGDVFENAKGEAETLAGFILQINKSFPKTGQRIVFYDYVFTVESVDIKRIKRVKVTINKM
ncbi:MAG: gliding motility-associated protein GldE [Flavobacteriales bacterium]|nr:gliding motility-associated protein GldE [Flavobacteriales bacterium]